MNTQFGKDPLFGLNNQVGKDPLFGLNNQVGKDPLFGLNNQVSKDPLFDLNTQEIVNKDKVPQSLPNRFSGATFGTMQVKIVPCRPRFTKLKNPRRLVYKEPVVCQGHFSVPLAAITGDKAVDAMNFALAEMYTQVSAILENQLELSDSSCPVKKSVGGLRTHCFVLRGETKNREWGNCGLLCHRNVIYLENQIF